MEIGKQNADGVLGASINNGEDGSAEVFRPYLEKLAEFTAEGWTDSEKNAVIEDSYNSAILRFFEGDVPFLCASTSTASGCAKRESQSEAFTANPFSYTFIGSPVGEDGTYIYINVEAGLAVNKESPNVDYAEEFIRFYCTVDELNASADAKGMISPSSDASASDTFPDLDLTASDYVGYTADFTINSAANNALDAAMNAITVDGATVDEAIELYYTTYAEVAAEEG